LNSQHVSSTPYRQEDLNSQHVSSTPYSGEVSNLHDIYVV